MTFIVDYATISPSVLAYIIDHAVSNAIPMWTDRTGEDFFEMSIAWWNEDIVTSEDLHKIEVIVKPYLA